MFFYKHLFAGQDLGLPSIAIKEKAQKSKYIYIENKEQLIQLAQLNTLEIHLWPVQIGDLEHPDQMIFDLDPDPLIKPAQVIEAAKALRKLLTELKLDSFVRSTGGKGLHVVVPLAPVHSWEQVKEFSEAVA